MSNNKKLKKLFVPKFISKPMGQQSSSSSSPAVCDTLNRIVCAKEEARKKWEEEQVDFDRRRRQYEINMLEIEQAEFSRREDEIRRKMEEMQEKKRKNKLIQDTVSEQIQALNRKMDEYRLSHKKEEEEMEDELTSLEDKLMEVKASIDGRMANLQISCKDELDFNDDGQSLASPSAPSHSEHTEGSMYPTLPVPTSRSVHSDAEFVRKAAAINVKLVRPISSQGSSPHTSSRSETPRTDQSDFDTSA